MIWQLDLILLVFLVITAFISLRVRDLLGASMVFGIYSFLICLLWAVMGAVDVAFTEAAVGAGVSTVILVATVYHTRRVTGGHKRASGMKLLSLLLMLVLGGVLLHASGDFPALGDAHSPANDHPVASYYIEGSYKDTKVPNLVTSVLADYRGYDTLFETVVVFVAGIGILAVIGVPTARMRKEEVCGDTAQFGGDSDLIILQTCRLVVPVIQLFALYVIAHGHYSPGGGFQGGVLFGASYILLALSGGLREALRRLSESKSLRLAAFGIVIYAGVGLLCMALGSSFLDYAVLESILPVSAVKARYYSMLIVEAGVGFTVTTILFVIYANLATRGKLEGGL